MFKKWFDVLRFIKCCDALNFQLFNENMNNLKVLINTLNILILADILLTVDIFLTGRKIYSGDIF